VKRFCTPTIEAWRHLWQSGVWQFSVFAWEYLDSGVRWRCGIQISSTETGPAEIPSITSGHQTLTMPRTDFSASMLSSFTASGMRGYIANTPWLCMERLNYSAPQPRHNTNRRKSHAWHVLHHWMPEGCDERLSWRVTFTLHTEYFLNLPVLLLYNDVPSNSCLTIH
jgi:hypothetical protein